MTTHLIWMMTELPGTWDDEQRQSMRRGMVLGSQAVLEGQNHFGLEMTFGVGGISCVSGYKSGMDYKSVRTQRHEVSLHLF